MQSKFRLLRFLATNIIWVIAIFILATLIFFIMRVVAFYWIGGEFLFSSNDIFKSFKISMLCGPLCSIGCWFLYWHKSRYTS